MTHTIGARRAAAVSGVVLALVTTPIGSTAHAAGVSAGPCEQAPRPGVPIPSGAPQDPVIAQLGLEHAWPLSTGAGVTVAVVDTGVDPASPKLRGAVAAGQTYRAVATKQVFTHTSGQVDCDGHGTEIAGIVAGRTAAGDDRVSGVAPSAGIYPVAVQGDIAQAPDALVAAAIRDAASHADVINLSFARPTDNPEIKAAVTYALDRNVVVVAAAANVSATTGSTASAPSYPAAYDGVLAVAAVGTDGQPNGDAASGPWVSLAAPGAELTTVSRGGSGYVTVSGSSFATALVSGAAALLRARFPRMPAAQIREQLEQTAVPPGSGRRDDQIGYGIVDPYAALTTLSDRSTAPAARPGRIRVPAVGDANTGDPVATTVAVAVVLALVAIVVGLATLGIRAARRRGWQAGARPRAPAEVRRDEPHGAELS